ncbi:MBL fold metallo-hydrolase [Prevotella sp.]|uniref:MBL fold metallo-hydrolase n=1 Tax=Prevotella sp. TaxID=59823 RepID=UPI002675E6B8
MIKLTYIFHSCFMLETEQCVLIFDYWKDSPEGDVKKMLEHTGKRVYFMASHFHEDHFNPEIIAMNVPNGDKRIILSRDIIRRHRAKETDADVVMRKGDVYNDEYIKIKAFGSTDAGVSFMLETDGKKIFHAGDLNNWHWEDESTPQEVKKMEGDFKAVLRDIKAEHPAVDLAMFPVDPRLGTDFARGARQWIQTIKTTYLAPMHFPPAREKAMTFGKEAEMCGTKFLYIRHEGELIATI